MFPEQRCPSNLLPYRDKIKSPSLAKPGNKLGQEYHAADSCQRKSLPDSRLPSVSASVSAATDDPNPARPLLPWCWGRGAFARRAMSTAVSCFTWNIRYCSCCPTDVRSAGTLLRAPIIPIMWMFHVKRFVRPNCRLPFRDVSRGTFRTCSVNPGYRV